MNEKDFSQLVKGRRTVHSYIEKDVPSILIEEAVALSLWAPNHRLSFPWKYFLLEKEKQNEFFSWACESKKVSQATESPLLQATKDQFLNPRILVMGIKKDPNPAVQKEDYATLSCSVQIMSMFFWQRGIGTKWSTGKISRDPRFYKMLGISESEIGLEGFLVIGYPKDILPPVERPAIEQVFKKI